MEKIVRAASPNLNLPLVVDLDGTLTPTDTLIESLVKVLKQSPFGLIRIFLWLLKGRAEFKEKIASRVSMDGALLPYRLSLLDYLRDERLRGRRIVLATAAHRSIADSVASHLGLFDQVLATENGLNLKGEAKLKAIQENVGIRFVYAGDSRADLPIWMAAQAAVLVNVSAGTAAVVRKSVQIELEIRDGEAEFNVWLRALRVHQWLKNLLLFVPALTAFSFLEVSRVIPVVVAFFSFSFAASATYIMNDLWDLDNDREHPRKRLRPFASARISIPKGLAVAGGLLCLSVFLSISVSPWFSLMLLLYLILTSAYSWVLKEYVLIDVLMLAMLYTHRILAGSLAVAVVPSSWLTAFSVFMFLSLALVKRCAELVALKQAGAKATRGRDYRVSDLVVLWPLGVCAALAAVVVFGLFISAPETLARYGFPQMLWFVALGLIYWLARLWIKTARGEMHDDPVIYAIKDSGSRLTLFFMTIVMVAAHFFSVDILL